MKKQDQRLIGQIYIALNKNEKLLKTCNGVRGGVLGGRGESGGSSLYGLYKYARPQKVKFLIGFGLR